jgi:hypothetical protein
VEFALVAPFFFMLLLAIVEFGLAVYTIQILNNAAREGARYAIVHGNDSTRPTGPPPGWPVKTNRDPYAADVKQAVRDYAIGVIGATGTANFVVTVCYIKPGLPHVCPDNNTGNDMGTGDNSRGNPPQNVNVTVKYAYKPFIAGIVPMPAFEITGESTLVINH